MGRLSRVVICISFLSACSKKAEPPPVQTGSGSGSGAAMAGSGSAMADSGSGSGSGSAMMGSGSGEMAGSDATDKPMSHKAGNCPSTVLGAKTTDKLVGKAIVVTITAEDKDAIAAIQKRTDELLKEKVAPHPTAGAMHDQKGGHGGGIGMCPVYVPEGATSSAKTAKKGVTVTITTTGKIDDLKQDIDARIARAEQWVKDNIKPGDKGDQGGVGGGSGDHGSNHSGSGDSKGKERDGSGGGGKGTGGGGGKGTGGGSGH
ncbi:MAG: hypothetical protein ABI467_13375 [Kofleriaceae bacterium]